MKRVKTRKTFSTAKQSLKIGDEKSDIVQVDAPTESETLSLSNCKLRSLPNITAHPYLKHLDLSNNNIESVS
jgi:Leucine-rich repeat (LRR) protein